MRRPTGWWTFSRTWPSEPGGDREAVVARELTKLHEEIRSGNLLDLIAHYTETEPRGEITVILSGAAGPAASPELEIDLERRGAQLLAEGVSRKDVVQRLVEETGMARNEVYRRVMELPQ